MATRCHTEPPGSRGSGTRPARERPPTRWYESARVRVSAARTGTAPDSPDADAAGNALKHDREPDKDRAWYGPLAEVLLGGGLRIGEALALEWRHVLWDESSLRVEIASKRKDGIGTTKGNRARTVAIDSGLVEALRRHRVTSGGAAGLVFRSKAGELLDVDNVRRRGHVAALAKAGLPSGVRLHDLRHSCARWWLASGASIFFVQQQLGHADIQTTIDLYGHADQATHRELAESAAAWRRAGAV